MKQIVKFETVRAQNESEFRHMVGALVTQFQSEGFEVEIQYSFSAVNLLVQYYTAMVIAHKAN